MSDTEMICVDDDSTTSPPQIAKMSLEDEAVSTTEPESTQEVDTTLSRSDRKNRAKRTLPDYYCINTPNDSDNEESHQQQEMTPEEVDAVDINELLESVEQLPPIKKPSGTQKRSSKAAGKAKANGTAAATRRRAPAKPKNRLEEYSYDPEAVRSLAKEYPDAYWRFHADADTHMVDELTEDIPVETVNVDISDHAAIVGMTLSEDGRVLATFSSVGSIGLYAVTKELRLLRRLRDPAETNIEEYWCGQFAGSRYLVAGGKLKDRNRWSAADEDNHILPCPIKVSP